MEILPLPAEDVKAVLGKRAEYIDSFLGKYMNEMPFIPARLREAMKYSLQAGGKRLRPVLCMTIAMACGLDKDKVLPFATAIELIHTYSLIHDDLPAMDNDDFRRGKPSNHKQFDEATAILAGDGLLTDAFFLALATRVKNKNLLSALKELALAAGSQGMVGGQMLDMEYTALASINIEQLAQMQQKKTGAMLTASCVCGAILADAPEDQIAAYKNYGTALGKAFQITDDILDLTGDEEILGKPVGSDAAAGKITYPSMLGLEKSRLAALQESQTAIRALCPSKEADFLAGLADYTVTRSK